jgi:hypothetical protein
MTKSDAPTTAPPNDDGDVPDRFVTDSSVAAEFDVTLMSIWRWDRSPEMAALGWPSKIQIQGRNFRSRKALEKFKVSLLKKAAADRKKLAADHAA